MARKRSAKRSKRGGRRSTSCPPGKIMRKSFTRRSKRRGSAKATRVSRSCVKDMGRPGKGPKTLPALPASEKHLLGAFGYTLKKGIAARHEALKRAIAAYGANKVIWHLTYIHNITALQANRDILDNDRDFVRHQK